MTETAARVAAPILRADRRPAVVEALATAGIEARRVSGYMADHIVITWAHVEDHEVEAAVKALTALGWSHTTIENLSGMLAITTHFN